MKISHAEAFQCESHDQIGWAHHRITESLAAIPSQKIRPDGEPLTIAEVIAQGRAALEEVQAYPHDGSGRNAFRYAHGSGAAILAECEAAGLDVTGWDRRQFPYGPVPPSRPVTLAAIVRRRRAVRAARYAGGPDTITLPGVAYASTGDQVLTEAAIAHGWTADTGIVRGGHCHAPALAIADDQGTPEYVPVPLPPEAARSRRKTPETAAKEIRRAIGNVAAGKRPEGWARDRLHKYAEILDVDVYDALVDDLDAALELRITADPDRQAGTTEGGAHATIVSEAVGSIVPVGGASTAPWAVP